MSIDTAQLLTEYLQAIPDFEKAGEYLHEEVTFQLFTPQGKERQGRERILGGLQREFQNFYRLDSFDLTVNLAFGNDEYAANQGGRSACAVCRFEGAQIAFPDGLALVVQRQGHVAGYARLNLEEIIEFTIVGF